MAKAALKQGKLFVTTVMAMLTGDQDEVVATRNARLAIAATKSQISTLEGLLVKEEIAADTAAENLKKAKFPTTPIGEGEDYIISIKRAQERLDEANQAVVDVTESIDYYTAQLAEFMQ